MSVRGRVALGVALGWLVVAVVWGAQNALGSALQGGDPAMGQALRVALLQSLPWIPGTLVVLAVTARWPVTRTTWRRRLPVHLAALLVVALVVNGLVVAGFGLLSGSLPPPAVLLREGARWAAIRIHVVALLYGALAAGTQAFAYHRAARARELRLARLEGQLTRARLDALNAQIRPHFLFNTLHTIGQLWRSGRPDDADAMLDHLGTLFHRVQGTSRRGEVPLEEELAMVEDYLAIERARFPDRLRAAVRADAGAAGCPVPPLLLQPLVENAIRHGVSTRSSAGLVEVEARVEGDRLHIVVRDDGPGFGVPDDRGRNGAAPAPAAATTSRSGSGTGLRNTRERLAELYGARASLEIGHRDGGGAEVRLTLPVGGASADG